MPFRDKIEHESVRTQWVDLKTVPGFRVQLRYVSREELDKALIPASKAQRVALGKKGDNVLAGNDAYTASLKKFFALNVVQDWELPPEVLPSLLALPEDAYPTKAIPFDEDDMLLIMEENTNVYNDVFDAATDRAAFYQELYEARAKNSSSGSSAPSKSKKTD